MLFFMLNNIFNIFIFNSLLLFYLFSVIICHILVVIILENNIERANLIFIALTYNYIANNERTLSESEVSRFIEKVSANLEKAGKEYNIEENDTNDYKYYGFEFNKMKEEYKLVSLKDWLYDMQPQDIITATLCDNALFAIYVDKSKLEIQTNYTFESGIMSVYSLENKRAKNSTKSILENKGCININIGLAIPDQLDGDKGYRVVYSCDVPNERAKVLSKEFKKK